MPVRLIKRFGIGFLLGVAVSAVIAWRVAADGGEVRALPAQLTLSGLYGACCMGGTVLYEIESWPLLKSTALHGLIVTLLYAPIALALGWAESPRALLLTEGLMLAAFLVIWCLMYLRCKAEVRRLNEIMKKRNEQTNEPKGNRFANVKERSS